MSAITTHVLDTSRGAPAAGIAVRLERLDGDGWSPIAQAATDADGRCRALTTGELVPGRHRLTFATGDYFAARNLATFYPEVMVTFEVGSASEHYHVPLLLSPHGYSTYRGS